MIKALLLDVDGVLLVGEAWHKDLPRDFGISAEMLASFFQGPFQRCLLGQANLLEELPGYLDKWRWPYTRQDFLGYWFQRYTLDTTLLQTMQELRQRGLPCFLATQQERYRCAYLLEKVGLGRYFDGCFSSCEIGLLKDQPAFFEAILGQFPHLQPAEILFWDDSPRNVQAASQAGLQAQVYHSFTQFQEKLSTLDLAASPHV